MAPGELLSQLLLGGLLGAVGQGLRVVVGLKKVWDESRSVNRQFAELFSTQSLLLSLLIGFVAGVLGIVSLTTPDLDDRQTLVTLIGVGYAGADFIEGFIKSRIPSVAGRAGGPPTREPDDDPVPPPVG